MDTVKGILNFSGENGEVTTFFGGRVTLSQLIMIIVAIVVVIILFKFVKGVFRIVGTIAMVCIALVHFGLASPEQLKDVGSQIAQNGVAKYQTYASLSENIKIEDNSVKIKAGDTWIDVSQVKSIIATDGDSYSITANGKSYVVNDKQIIKLLDTFK